MSSRPNRNVTWWKKKKQPLPVLDWMALSIRHCLHVCRVSSLPVACLSSRNLSWRAPTQQAAPGQVNANHCELEYISLLPFVSHRSIHFLMLIQHSPVGYTELNVRQTVGRPHGRILLHRSYGQFNQTTHLPGINLYTSIQSTDD